MSQFYHAIVWIDHQEAKVFRFTGSDTSETQVHSHASLQHLHHRRGGWEAGGNPAENGEFFHRVAGTLDQAAKILVTGPGNAKSAFKAYMEHLRPNPAFQVSTVETIDHPSDEALLALGRTHFTDHGSQAPPGERHQRV